MTAHGIPIALQFEMPGDLWSLIAALMSWSIFLILGLLVVLGIIWVLVPFAIFGIKPRLDRLIATVGELVQSQKAILENLQRIEQRLGKAEDEKAAQPPKPEA